MRFLYAEIYGIPPHDPSLLVLSDYEMELYIRAKLKVRAILSGREKPGPSSAFLEEAKRRKEEYAQQQEKLVPVTPEELGWNDNA